MYFAIDTFMTRGLKLSKTELLVYALIHNFSQDGQGCYWGSMKETAENLNCAENSVKNAIRALVARNLIKCVGFHPQYHTNQYVAIVPAALKNEVGAKIGEGVKNCPPAGVKNCPIGGQKLPPIRNNNKEIINNSVPSIFNRQI